MSNLLSQASLVMIPSGYKEDVVYSPVPTDGSGDLSFTRASNGTRINSAGLVEDCPWNLLGYSEEFNNAAWDKVGTTITANATTAPNGTNTADNLIPSNGTQLSWVLQNFTSVVGSTYTISLYVKSTDYSFVQITGSTGFLSEYQNFNISTGALATGSGGTATITSVGNGWYRITYSLTCISTGTTNRFIITVQDSGTAARLASCTGNGTKFVSIWGAQLNIGSTAKPYFPTTDRLNVARLTYQNGGGGCPSLLLEKQSTNLLTYSEQFDNAAWVKSSGSVTANQATSPDGTQNADLIAGEVYQQKTQANATTYTMSVFAKKQSATTVYIGYIDNVTGFAGGSIVYTYSTGAITVNQSANSSVSGKAIDMGNGWIRLSITYTTIALVTFNYQYIGSTGSYIYGAQLEASSYPTSYISTQAASATRVADACFNTSATALIGQTEGTILLDCEILTTDTQDLLSIRPGGTSSLAIGTASNLILGYVIEGATVISMSFANYAINTRYKIALAYKNGDCALYVNGTQADIDTTAFTFSTALSSLYLGQSQYFGKSSYENNEIVLFKTRLTNAELASLTTI